MIGYTCMLLCGFLALHLRAVDRGCQPAPGLPCALLDRRVKRPSKARAKSAARVRSCVCRLKCTLEDGDAAPCSVIASVAKQSRAVQRRDSGLLRCARNDDAARVRQTPLSCPGRCAAPLRCAAEPGPISPHYAVSPSGPGSAQQRCALQRVRDTGASGAVAPRHKPTYPHHNQVSLFGNNHSLLSRSAKRSPQIPTRRPSARPSPGVRHGHCA
ncbi:hypothetical protein ABIB00_007455 [Bradyrhizobium sp. LB14.3]